MTKFSLLILIGLIFSSAAAQAANCKCSSACVVRGSVTGYGQSHYDLCLTGGFGVTAAACAAEGNVKHKISGYFWETTYSQVALDSCKSSCSGTCGTPTCSN